MIFARVLGTELSKLRRSSVTWLSAVFYLFFGFLGAFVVWMLKNPESARSLGLIGQKASFAMNGISADWAGLFSLFDELGMAGGMVLLSIIVTYLYRREYVEGTAKNMLALPVPRAWFAAAKLVVAAIWFAILSAILLAESFAVGSLLGLGPLPPGALASEAARAATSTLLVLALQPIVAWIAVASRGYLAPFGYTIATLIVGNLMIRTLWARWCPWSIVALLSGLSGPRQENRLAGSAPVMAATFALGLAGTIAHQARADNCQ